MISPKDPLKSVDRVAYPIKRRSGMVTLDRNERTVDLPENVIDDVRRLVTGFLLRAYPEMDDVYQALSEWSGLSVNRLLFTEGADGGLHRVFASYVSENDRVVVLSPSYGMYPVYCQLYGAQVEKLTYDENLCLQFERILSSVGPDTKLVAIANPNQPIESYLVLSELRLLAKQCALNGVLLLVDEAYYHFCQITAVPLIDEFDNVIVVRTFSKAFGLGGLRVGYIIAAPHVIKALCSLKPTYEINHLNAAIVTYFLRNRQIMENYVALVGEGRKILRSWFSRLGWEVAGKCTNSLLIELPAEISARGLEVELHEKGWLVRAETASPLTNHLRVTIGPPDQMVKLCEQVQASLAGARSIG